MWGERPARGELDSSEEGEEEQEGERGGGWAGGLGWSGGGGWGGRDRLKLSQGDDVDENVPLRKGETYKAGAQYSIYPPYREKSINRMILIYKQIIQ